MYDMGVSENPFEIDRFSPDVKIQVGRFTMSLNYDNTDIYQFGRGYGMFDHIHVSNMVEGDVDENEYIFNCDDLIKALIAHDFPRHYFPYPPKDLVEFYLTHTVESIDQEMGGLDGK